VEFRPFPWDSKAYPTPSHASEPEMWSDASSPTPGDGFSLSLEPGLTGATGFLKLVSFLRRNIAIRS